MLLEQICEHSPKDSNEFVTKDTKETNQAYKLSLKQKEDKYDPNTFAFIKGSILAYLDTNNNLVVSRLKKNRNAKEDRNVLLRDNSRVRYIGAQDEALILVGYEDGQAEVYKYEEGKDPVRILPPEE